MSSLCSEKCTCGTCGDRQCCDLYYAVKGFQLLEARFEEDWHEQRQR